MFKWICLIKKKRGVSRQEFMDYYENNHVPLVRRMFPEEFSHVRVYRRNYIVFDDPVVKLDAYEGLESATGFDVVTECITDTREQAYALLQAAFKNPENAKLVMEDEDKFIERGSALMYVVEARETDFSKTA